MNANLEFTVDGFNGFALQSQAGFIPPSALARGAALAAEVAAAPTPEPPPPRPIFRLSPAELAKIDRNLARLAKFTDSTQGMF